MSWPWHQGQRDQASQEDLVALVVLEDREDLGDLEGREDQQWA